MSQAYKTEQERIDDLTMKIKNPNVVGSGFISFPPQTRFDKPLLVQPPTISHLEFPDEWKGVPPVPAPSAPRPGGPVAGQPGMAPARPVGASTGYRPPAAVRPPVVASSGAPHMNGHGHPHGHPQQHPQHHAQQHVQHQQAQHHHPHQYQQQRPGVGQTGSGAPHGKPHSQQHMQGRPAAPVAHSALGHRPAAPVPTAVNRGPVAAPSQQVRQMPVMVPVTPVVHPVAVKKEEPKKMETESDDGDDAGGLSKAQKKRLRKKLRDNGK